MRCSRTAMRASWRRSRTPSGAPRHERSRRLARARPVAVELGLRGAGRGGGGGRAGVRALLEFLDDEPGLGRLCVVDALGAGPMVLARRAQVVAALVDAVDRGRGVAG